MSLLLFILITFGLTQILVYSKITEFLRDTIKMLHCSQCTGFHVGWFILVISQWTELINFELSWVNAFLLSCLSSGTSYILCTMFDDEGLKIKRSYNQ